MPASFSFHPDAILLICSLLFSSQDHQFVQTIANRIMELTSDGLIDRQCTYDEYLESDEAARKRQVLTINTEDDLD